MKKDALLNPKLKTETVEVDGVGTFEIRELSARDVGDYASKSGKVNDVELQCFLIARSIVEDGVRLYRDKDVDQLMNNSASTLTVLTDAILRLNGFAEDHEKNS